MRWPSVPSSRAVKLPPSEGSLASTKSKAQRREGEVTLAVVATSRRFGFTASQAQSSGRNHSVTPAAVLSACSCAPVLLATLPKSFMVKLPPSGVPAVSVAKLALMP